MFKKVDNILGEICRHKDKDIEGSVIRKNLIIYDGLKKVT